MRSVVAFLLLGLAWPAARASLDMSKYILDATACDESSPGLTSIPYGTFGLYRGPLRAVQVDNATNELIITYPADNAGGDLVYKLEGVRLNYSICSYCPYSAWPEAQYPEYIPSSGIRNVPAPMYGPCFDGQASTVNRMSCVQNLALYPPDFCGEYFYPDQTLDAWVRWQNAWNPFFYHSYIEGSQSATDIQNEIGPTYYGLGKGNVQNYLQSYVVRNVTSGQTVAAATQALQAPYQTDAQGVERWPKFAQHFCRIACHRDSFLAWAQVRSSDYAGMPQRFYLSRMDAATHKLPQIFRCLRCPSLYHAAYQWGAWDSSFQNYDSNQPDDPRSLIKSYPDCFPWFGAVPILKSSALGLEFNTVTNVMHSSLSDGITYPPSHRIIEGTPCPPNTYNDRCAHYFLLGGDNSFACKPCPPGFHTAGLSGAWFCLPPPGQTALLIPGTITSPTRNVLNMFVSSNNMSMAWARRDLLGYEWECGTLPRHCYQCGSVPGTFNMTPDAFNQKMIVRGLFVWQNCPEGYYCPSALASPPLKCPDAFVWSPAGSFDISNCTCPSGSFLEVETHTCKPCPSRSICPTGQYLSGYIACNSRGGMRSGGTCTNCTNKPPNAVYSQGAGIEITTQAGAYVGICPFACPPQTRLRVADVGCRANAACEAVTQIRSNGVMIYQPALKDLTDSFVILPSCGVNATLGARLDRIPVTLNGWLQASSSCAAASSQACPPTGAVCYVTKNATFYSDFECGPCPTPPRNGYMDAGGGLPFACTVVCATAFYFNQTAQTCGQCSTLDALCGVNGFMMGGGCYGSSIPFPTNDLALLASSNCHTCNKPLSSCSTDQYMDLNPGGTSTCACKPCFVPGSMPGQYIATPCGGTQQTVLAWCTTNCSAGYFLSGQCTRNSTPVCMPCTTFLQGSYRISNCGATADGVWQRCGLSPSGADFSPGYYCVGDGTQLACPNNRTSSVGAYSRQGCYCPAGTVVANQDGDTCTLTRCADATVSTFAPGAGWRSNAYMTLDADQSNACVPCTASLSDKNNAMGFSLMDGVGLAACTCPPNYYASVDATSMQCVPCPSAMTCSGGGYYVRVPDACWSGRTRAPPTCECIWPPFFGPRSDGVAAACEPSDGVCAPGFEAVPGGGGGVPSQHVSGSAMYATRTDSTGGWQALLPVTMPHRVQELVVTSDLMTADDDGYGAQTNTQYVLWILQAPDELRRLVFALPLNTQHVDVNTAASASYGFSGGAWSVVESSYPNEYALQHLAVAQWPLAQTQARLFSASAPFSKPTDVAVVLIDMDAKPAGSSLWLFTNKLQVDIHNNGFAGWVTSGSKGLDLGTPPNATSVAVGHAYLPPGGAGAASDPSTFYVAVQCADDTSQILAVSPSAFKVLSILKLSLGVTAMTLLPRPDNRGVNLYVASAGVDNTIQLVEWSSAITVPSLSSELFLASTGGSTISALLPMLWPSTSLFPQVLALVTPETWDAGQRIRYRDDGQPPLSLYVADPIQRTFVPIQDIPLGTHPVALGVTGYGRGAALLVGANASALFTLSTTVCMPQSSATGVNAYAYWDGTQCQRHVCARSRACSQSAGQTWDFLLLRCVCAPGYYGGIINGALACTLCAPDASSRLGYYCPGNGTRISCPTSMTSPVGASAATDCRCLPAQYFAPDKGACQPCPGGKWCPNNWTAVPCPGAYDAASSALGYAYPTPCACAAGFTGARCTPCPPNFICPAPHTVTMATFALSLVLSSAAPFDAVCPRLLAIMADYFKVSTLYYLSHADLLIDRMVCTLVRAPNDRTHIADVAILMVLADAADKNNDMLSTMGKAIDTDTLSALSVQTILPSAQLATIGTIFNNTPTACAAGKTPSQDATQCICAPGFRTAAESCSACAAGQYKATSGAGTCFDCPIGTTSSEGASVCVGITNGSNNNGNANSNSNNNNNNGLSGTTVGIIAGSVGGGVVVVGLLVWTILTLSPG